MRTVQASEITKNIREMCIEANHFLSDDMKKVFDESVKREESPLGTSFRRIWRLPGET